MNPSSDFRVIEEVSGAAGALASMTPLFGRLNDALTTAMDAMDRPDATDAFDASCNTCLHFQRQSFDRRERVISVHGFPGTCARTAAAVTGWPRGQFCGHACYENRRTGEGSGRTEDFLHP